MPPLNKPKSLFTLAKESKEIQRDSKRFKDLFFEVEELVKKHGYEMETHEVVTDDGYILQLHRIPRGKGKQETGVRAPVLLQHGMILASDSWVLSEPDNSLGFILADNGYDVWMGNARGNFYSRHHVTLSPDDPAFWDFSFHEMGVSDLPSVIDYILSTTTQERLFYIGHSMGTTMMFTLLSTKPEYNDKIRLVVALAPVATTGQPRTFTHTLVRYFLTNIVHGFLDAGMVEMSPRRVMAPLADVICRERMVGREICLTTYRLLFGASRNFNTSTQPEFYAHFSGCSTNTLAHFLDNIEVDKFQMYDRTRRGRAMPEYDLSKVTAPVSLHYAQNDALLHPEAVKRLSKQLSHTVAVVKLEDEVTNHLDLVVAVRGKKLVYDEVLRLMHMY